MITTKKRPKQIGIELEFDELLLIVWKQKEEINQEWEFIADYIWGCLCQEKS